MVGQSTIRGIQVLLTSTELLEIVQIPIKYTVPLVKWMLLLIGGVQILIPQLMCKVMLTVVSWLVLNITANPKSTLMVEILL